MLLAPESGSEKMTFSVQSPTKNMQTVRTGNSQLITMHRTIGLTD